MQVSRIPLWSIIGVLSLCSFTPAFSQSLGGAGTIEGVVTDPSGAVITNALVEISNAISGYRQRTITDSTGDFRFSNVPVLPS